MHFEDMERKERLVWGGVGNTGKIFHRLSIKLGLSLGNKKWGSNFSDETTQEEAT